MITDSFDSKSPAIINPEQIADAPIVDAVVMTFSFQIEKYVCNSYAVKQIALLHSTTGVLPVYQLEMEGKRIGFFRNFIGGPAAVGMLEDLLAVVNTSKVVMFGGAGSLDKEIDRGKIMVPNAAYRDEGTSYHYVPAAEEIALPQASLVEAFFKSAKIPYVVGKTWTTDAIYRETRSNFEKRKRSGCISVEMEVASLQAACSFRGIEFYPFLKSGDLLDAPEWDSRSEFGVNGSQHDPRYAEIAFRLALHIA